MPPHILHLHTYFVFPFSIDQHAVMEDHPRVWAPQDQWFDKLDDWVIKHVDPTFQELATKLKGWRRSAHTSFGLGSAAYQDMVFFHPFIRRAFFDTGSAIASNEALVRSYVIEAGPGSRLLYLAKDTTGHSVEIEITCLKLLLFGNGIGLLTIGVEARDISFVQGLWINEMMRKTYPSSDRQIATGRTPNYMALCRETDGRREVLIEEQFCECELVAFRPQLSRILLGLLRFANYAQREYEPLLDERMVVNTFLQLDGEGLPADYMHSEDYQVSLSRLLYVDRDGAGYRYDPEFTRKQMGEALYRRWQHQGTVYGVTSYSNVTCVLARPELANSNALVYRMFTSKNHLIATIALFYRVTLLDFAKEAALISRQLFPLFSGKVVRHRHIQFATRLMADFHYFNNYWFFDELTTKDEELEHFQMFCKAYRIEQLKKGLTSQISMLAGYIDRLYMLRNSDAVNRLAMLSIVLGIGALITGFYGMNIPHLEEALHYRLISSMSVVGTLLMTVASLVFIAYIVGSNWIDFRASLLPHRYRKTQRPNSLRTLAEESLEND